MALNQSSDEARDYKPRGHLRYESLLKAMPPDILRELVKRKLEEIALIREHPQKPKAPQEGLRQTSDTILV